MRFLFLFFGGISVMAGKTALERDFQSKLIAEIEARLPGAIVAKIDPLQGIPDLLILYNDRWALLECKRHAKANRQPNQEYYVDLLDRMSFSRFIFPENKSEVLDELQQALQSKRPARVSRRK